MFVVSKGIFINPLQVESIRFIQPEIIFDTSRNRAPWLVIKMTSGQEFEIKTEDVDDLNATCEKLVYQIDIANGMSFEEEDDNKEPEEIKSPWDGTKKGESGLI